jgi:phosphate starvation-inducible PhoH-like protein
LTNIKGTNKRRNKLSSDEVDEVINYKSLSKNKTFKETLNRTIFDKAGIVLSTKQQDYFKTIKDNILTVVQGPAGTSKTFLACYTSLILLIDGKIDNIIITKPIQESGENLGFLPGTVEEKTEPYLQSYKSNFLKIISPEIYQYLTKEGYIKFEAIAYMRGLTFDRSLLLLDEAQNLTIQQLMLWVTRIGKGSKGVLMGDVSQYDIKRGDVKLTDFIDKILTDVNNVGVFNFNKEDIVRNPILIQLVDNYEKYRENQYKESLYNNRKK